MSISGINVFYREAGHRDAPALVLLCDHTSSSRVFETPPPLLADRFRLIAPDYTGFGRRDASSPEYFSYTFDSIATVIEKFMNELGLTKFAL